MKRMILAFVLVMFSSCVAHAQDSSSKGNTHVRVKKENKKAKEKKDDDVTYVGFGDDEATSKDNGDYPAITPKGKL